MDSFQGALRFYTNLRRPYSPPLQVFAPDEEEAQGQIREHQNYEYHALFDKGILLHLVRVSSDSPWFEVEYYEQHTCTVDVGEITNEMVEAALAGDRRLVLSLEKKRSFAQ